MRFQENNLIFSNDFRSAVVVVNKSDIDIHIYLFVDGLRYKNQVGAVEVLGSAVIDRSIFLIVHSLLS